MYRISAKISFSASHMLREYAGKCARMHGHNWDIIVEISGEKLNDIGILVDFKDLKKEMNRVAEELDHTVLNEHPYFSEKKINPTAENIAYFFYMRLKDKFFPNKITKVEVYETEKYGATFIPD